MDWFIAIFAGAMFFSLTTIAVIMTYMGVKKDTSDEFEVMMSSNKKRKNELKKRPALDSTCRMPFIHKK